MINLYSISIVISYRSSSPHTHQCALSIDEATEILQSRSDRLETYLGNRCSRTRRLKKYDVRRVASGNTRIGATAWFLFGLFGNRQAPDTNADASPRLVNAFARARLTLWLRVLYRSSLIRFRGLLGIYAPHVVKLLCHKPRSIRGHSRGVYTYRASLRCTGAHRSARASSKKNTAKYAEFRGAQRRIWVFVLDAVVCN